MGANFKWESLNDLVRGGWNLAVRCRCGYSATLDAKQTLRWYDCHRWDTRKVALAAHLRCTRCNSKQVVALGISAADPIDHHFFPRREVGWRLLVKRLRG